MANQQYRSSIAMDRELFRTVRQAALNHARLLYHRLVSRLPHLLAVTFLVAAAQLVPMPPSPSAPLPPVGALLREAAARARPDAGLVAAALAGVAACACAYAALRPRPVYLVDLAAYRPGPAHRATRAESVHHFALAGPFTDESVAFQTRMLERAGVGDATHFPASILAVPVDMSLRAAREESEAVVFGVVDDLLRTTAVRAADVGVVIVNSSLFSPTPSFTSLLVNRYGLRHDVVTHNLSGMGCSAGIIAIDLARHLLQGDTRQAPPTARAPLPLVARRSGRSPLRWRGDQAAAPSGGTPLRRSGTKGRGSEEKGARDKNRKPQLIRADAFNCAAGRSCCRLAAPLFPVKKSLRLSSTSTRSSHPRAVTIFP